MSVSVSASVSVSVLTPLPVWSRDGDVSVQGDRGHEVEKATRLCLVCDRAGQTSLTTLLTPHNPRG
jgi:hypothetical protein